MPSRFCKICISLTRERHFFHLGVRLCSVLAPFWFHLEVIVGLFWAIFGHLGTILARLGTF